jgi:hypothetical protein
MNIPPHNDDLIKLDDLVININHEHIEAIQAARQSLLHAIRAGDLLLQAKDQVGHGAWLDWVKDNCKFSDRTARAYMRLAENKNLLPTNWQTSANLSIDGALQLITKPNPITTLEEFKNLDFEELEAKIEKDSHAFVKVGQAFKAIRDTQLYDSEFKSFGEYCEKKWGMNLRQVNEYINMSEIFTYLDYAILKEQIDQLGPDLDQAKSLTEIVTVMHKAEKLYHEAMARAAECELKSNYDDRRNKNH